VRNILNLAATDWRDHNGITWLAQAPRITCLDLDDSRPPRPLAWVEQRRLMPLLPDHLAEMALFMLNTGLRDEPVCNLRWDWEVPVPQLGCSVFIVPKEFVKGTRKSKRERVVVCNSVAQSIIERQRGKHPSHVFVYRRERVRNKDREPTMPYRPIQTMNNNGWQRARAAAGLGDLHVHDLRHTVGMRLREADVAESTISEILWHATKSMTQHYSMAQVVEVHRALEKIKDETHQWNVSLQSLVLEARAGRVTQNSRNDGELKRKTG
jgi:integrase